MNGGRKMARKKILSLALAAMMTASSVWGCSPTLYDSVLVNAKVTEVAMEAEQVAAEDYGLCDTTKEGAILHAFCWSFNTIKENMKSIAEAGYTTVQTSPINECLVGEGGGMDLYGNGKWYYHYQPTDWKIGNYQLGSRDDYKAMCAEADKYGIKIISDVLPNHTTPSLDAVSNDLANAAGGKYAGALYHNNGFNEIGNYQDRYECTLGQMGGLPDVNTENQGFQEYYLKFCNDVIACGGDGFRYDTAKHIGVASDPIDSANTRGVNDFWDIATGKKEVNGVKLNRPDNFFIYGEVLQDNGIPYKEYASYMEMTASSYGYVLRDNLRNSSLNSGSVSNWCHDTPDKIVTWVESHDTYCNEHNSAWMNDFQIRAGWAIIAARSQGTPLFFSRPDGSNGSTGNYWGNNKIGAAGNDQYKHPEVAACNQFRNAMVGEDEHLSNPNGNSSVLVIERGDRGAVVINMGSDIANVPLTNVADGTYTEEVSGTTVEVSNGTLEYTVKGGTIAVIYDGKTTVKNPTVKASKETGSTFNKAFDLTLTAKNATSATYKTSEGESGTFTGTETITIGATTSVGDTVTIEVTAEGGEGTTPFSQTFTYTMTEIPAYKLYVRAKKSDFSGTPTAYVYTDKGAVNGEWPGTKMELDGDYYYYASNDIDSGYIIFVDDNGQDPAHEEPGYKVSGYMEYNKSAKSVKTFVPEVTPTKTPVVETPGIEETPTPTPEVEETPIIDTTPIVEETPTVDKNISISVSEKEGTSFTTETMDVTVFLNNVTEATYSVDNGPEKALKSGDKVTLGQGKIADRDVELKIKASNGTTSETKTFTYKKVFDAATTKVKTSAISRIQSIFETVAEAAEVNAEELSGEPLASYFQTNPKGQTGSKKTITSASDFTEDMMIAQGVANDGISIFRGSHEGPVYDTYAMFGAYDDTNVYIGVQYTNVIDVVDPAQGYPQSDNGKPANGDIPQMMVFDTGSGDYTDGSTNDAKQKTAWDSNVYFSGAAKVDKVFMYSAKAEVNNTAWFPVSNGKIDYNNVIASKLPATGSTGITYTYEDGFFCSNMYGINGNGYNGYTPSELNSDDSKWVDFLTTSHNPEQDTFMIMTIPMSTLGVSADKVASDGIGVMNISTFGASGIGALPQDLSMLDVANDPYSADDSTSAEKEDADTVTVALARLGGTAQPSQKPTPRPVTSTPATETPDTTVTETPDATVTETPEATVTETPDATVTGTPDIIEIPEVTFTPEVTTVPEDFFTVNFGADRSSPQLSSTELALEAIVHGGDKNYKYEFAVDGTVVQESSSATKYAWNPTAGEHTIQVTVEDETGKKITSEKTYVIEQDRDEVNTDESDTDSDSTPEVTEEPTQIPDVGVVTEEPTQPTQTPEITKEPTQTSEATVTEIPTQQPTVTATVTPTLPAVQLGNTTPNPSVTITPDEIPNANIGVIATSSPEKDIQVVLSASKQSPQKAGTTVRLTLEVTGGTAPYTYVIQTISATGKVSTLLSSVNKNAVNWTPSNAGVYTIVGKVTDANGNVVTSSGKYTINNPISVNKFKTNKYKVKAGKKVVLTVKASSIDDVKYKFKVKKVGSSKFTVISKFTTKTKCTWKPTAKGKYQVYVQIKDVDGNTKTVRISKYITVK